MDKLPKELERKSEIYWFKAVLHGQPGWFRYTHDNCGEFVGEDGYGVRVYSDAVDIPDNTYVVSHVALEQVYWFEAYGNNLG